MLCQSNRCPKSPSVKGAFIIFEDISSDLWLQGETQLPKNPRLSNLPVCSLVKTRLYIEPFHSSIIFCSLNFNALPKYKCNLVQMIKKKLQLTVFSPSFAVLSPCSKPSNFMMWRTKSTRIQWTTLRNTTLHDESRLDIPVIKNSASAPRPRRLVGKMNISSIHSSEKQIARWTECEAAFKSR